MRTAMILLLVLAHVPAARAQNDPGLTDLPPAPMDGERASEEEDAPGDETDGLELEEKRWAAVFRVQADHTLSFDADFDEGDASIATNITRVGAGARLINPDQRLLIDVDISTLLADYEVDGGATLEAGIDDDPIDSLFAQNLAVLASYDFNRRWGVFGLGFLESGYEAGASFADGFQASGALGVNWTSDDASLRIGVGVLALSRLEDDALVVPIANVRWDIDERLRFRTEGLGARLVYDASDELDFSLLARFERNEYRLDDDNSIASDGVLSDNRVAIGAGLEWAPAGWDGLTLRLEGGAYVFRELEVLDDGGDEVFSEETEPQAFVRVGVTYEF
jgi:hypothetical protein